MITRTHINAHGQIDLPPRLLAEAGFLPETPLECTVRNGEIVVRKGPATLTPEQVREGIRRAQELSKDYAFTTEEVMRMTRGED